MHVKNSFKLLPILAAMAALSACGGSSSSSQPFQSQAVDGYVVGGTVECDGVANGLTKAAGSFNCPAGSHFSRITGGYDVGIDTVATTGTSPFTGVLGAPASAPYATPLTTLAVSLVNQAQSETSDDTSSKPVYNAALYEKALSDMAIVLGIPMEVIQANPAENVEAAKINAQVHQVTTAFAPSIDSYEHVTEAFATEIAGNIVSGASVDLSDNVSPVMTAINLILNQENSDNFLSITDLDQAIDNVSAANTAIENAESPAGVTVAAQNALINQAPVTIDRSNAVVDLYDDADQLLQNLYTHHIQQRIL